MRSSMLRMRRLESCRRRCISQLLLRRGAAVRRRLPSHTMYSWSARAIAAGPKRPAVDGPPARPPAVSRTSRSPGGMGPTSAYDACSDTARQAESGKAAAGARAQANPAVVVASRNFCCGAARRSDDVSRLTRCTAGVRGRSRPVRRGRPSMGRRRDRPLSVGPRSHRAAWGRRLHMLPARTRVAGRIRQSGRGREC